MYWKSNAAKSKYMYTVPFQKWNQMACSW